jgi:hypothetical protein
MNIAAAPKVADQRSTNRSIALQANVNIVTAAATRTPPIVE